RWAPARLRAVRSRRRRRVTAAPGPKLRENRRHHATLPVPQHRLRCHTLHHVRAADCPAAPARPPARDPAPSTATAEWPAATEESVQAAGADVVGSTGAIA